LKERKLTDKFVVGLIGAPFGLEGFVKVRPLSGEIDHLLRLRAVVIRKDGRERPLEIEESAAAPPAVVMRFAGINNPEAAKTLGGAELIVGRDQASPLRDGEFYVEDLKGLAVKDENGETLGHISGIVEGGGGELAEIRLLEGELRLVPFRQEFFGAVSLEKSCVELKNLWILE
jgi:16S rRNA processing protein RimM